MGLLEQFGIDIGYLCLGMAAIIVILIILLCVIIVRQNNLGKKYENFMKGDKDVQTMEELIQSRLEDIEKINKKADMLAKKIMEIDDILLGAYQKEAIVKYDAFREMGGNLSFVLAMLDKNNNGFLLNSMHSKEGCYTYIKDVVQGKVAVELSDEEREALQKAVNQS